MKYYIFEVYLG